MVRGSNSAGYPGDSGVAKALLIGLVGFLMGLFCTGSAPRRDPGIAACSAIFDEDI